MVHVIVELSKYLMIILIAMYTFQSYTVFTHGDPVRQRNIFRKQNTLMFLIHLTAYLVMYLQTNNLQILFFYAEQVILLAAILAFYHVAYPKASRLVVNNMCMLLSIGFIILTRLSFDKSKRQFVIVAVSAAVSLLVPFLVRKMKFLRNLTWLYAAAGIGLLGVVAVAGSRVYGAKLNISFGQLSVQPSEFVKISFVFFVAALLSRSTEFKDIVKATAVAVAHVLILVLSKDLGGALIYFVVYLIMLYVASRKPLYLMGGLAGGCVAAVAGYFLFGHVRTRVLAWSNPWDVIEKEGYQITQSLFAIGTGGWFGMGLFQGSPDKIPVVDQDFIFSAISEELGGIFALCLILICVSCFLMFINIAMQIKDDFYKLVALGLGTVYGFQVFLTIGGVTKFIPSTGVTLPLVSYGGSSMLSTLILFAIIQGMYLLREDEDGKANVQVQKQKIRKGTGNSEPGSSGRRKRDDKPEKARRKKEK
ncbi:FtsW/RodA/SpoVE family cell cycle protein [Diplocloster hominis]|uniref:FtsW/RodA/SpoVE family cell cycle protein n=1 Tax=Diplocloster hominis TaxID=3079010 RepID=UPI0031BBA218